MVKIAVIAALQKEEELLRNISGKDILVVQSGIGKVAAALKTLDVIQNFCPDLIINSGVAGGLDSSLKIGDIVCGEKVCYHDVWCGTPNAYGQVQDFPLFFESDAKALRLIEPKIKKGLIISGDQFISEKEALVNLKQKFPDALAVDMESAAIGQTCYMHRVPFLSLRLISDTPGVVHHQEQYDDFWRKAPEISFENIHRIIRSIQS